ncbi:MAG: phage head closure protein [Robiginitomaculum sp.]|nr:phage head closure protein [Robiginitomaculum sp.]
MIGKLRTRIGIYSPQNSSDDLGGVQTIWVLYGQAWAHIAPKTTHERTENGRAAITKTYMVIIRWQAGFPERVRLLWGDTHLRVLSASDPDMRRERLHLICEEEEQ